LEHPGGFITEGGDILTRALFRVFVVETRSGKRGVRERRNDENVFALLSLWGAFACCWRSFF